MAAAPRLNPHKWIERTAGPPVDRWRCQYCAAEGTFAELKAVACAHVYPPCQHCGQTPECAPDCKGIAGSLDPLRKGVTNAL
jgi:hypothetical protein